MQSIISLGAKTEDEKSVARLQLVNVGMSFMPGGVVDFEKLYGCAQVKQYINEIGKTKTQTLFFLMISDFCRSINVVRNMAEDQMIECAMYLMDECLDFTMEDYLIMFTLAKRSKIGNIMDHLDIEVIAEMHGEYLSRRQAEFKKIQEQKRRIEHDRKVEALKSQDPKISQGYIDAMKALAHEMVNREKPEDQRKHQQMISARDRQVMEMIETECARGVAPDKYLREYYLKKIGK